MKVRAEHKKSGKIIIIEVSSLKEVQHLNPSFYNFEIIG